MSDVLGVGVIGCGEAYQAIHLPILCGLPELFRVVGCMDVDEDLATTVGGRSRAAIATSDVDELVSDERVDVVVVCSPEKFHPEQVMAACRAGKRAVLCEKPLAASAVDARAIAAVSAETGVPVIVGTMHRYDPSFRAAEGRWGDLATRASVVRSTTWIPPNASLVAAATQMVRSARKRDRPDLDDLPFELWMFRLLMLGLAVHHLPLIRLAVPVVDEVLDARPLGSAGYTVTLRGGSRVAHLDAVLCSFSAIDWRFELLAGDGWARVEFPASYVAGPGGRSLTTVAGSNGLDKIVSSSAENGYIAEWRHVHEVVTSGASPLTPASGAVADIELALRIADAAVGTAGGTVGP